MNERIMDCGHGSRFECDGRCMECDRISVMEGYMEYIGPELLDVALAAANAREEASGTEALDELNGIGPNDFTDPFADPPSGDDAIPWHQRWARFVRLHS